MKHKPNPIMLIIALCACVIFPPAALVVIPAFALMVRTEHRALVRDQRAEQQRVHDKRRAKAIRTFASA